jgi:hypothetical protein
MRGPLFVKPRSAFFFGQPIQSLPTNGRRANSSGALSEIPSLRPTDTTHRRPTGGALNVLRPSPFLFPNRRLALLPFALLWSGLLRCQLVFSFSYRALPSRRRTGRFCSSNVRSATTSQSPELGDLQKLNLSRLLSLCRLLARSCYSATARTLRRSPTTDAEEPLAFSPPPPPLASWHSCRPARQVSAPIAGDPIRSSRA